MAVSSRTLNTVPGQYTVTSVKFFGTPIYGVARSGDIHNEVNTTPSSLEFRHVGATLYFDTTNPFNLDEKVWVLFED